MAHIKRIDEMNANGYTEFQEKDTLSRFFLWMSNAFDKKNDSRVSYICLMTKDILGDFAPATVNRFGRVLDEKSLLDIAKRGRDEHPWVWDTEETNIQLTPTVASAIKTIKQKGCYLLILFKDKSEEREFLDEFSDSVSYDYEKYTDTVNDL